MIRRLRLFVPVFLLPLAACAGSGAPAAPAPAASQQTFVGVISESDCAEDHAAMLRTGTMGKTDRECILKCVRMGAAFGLVDADRKTFYLLDDQMKPRPFAGRRVRVTGRLDGDTIYVAGIEAAD